MTRGTHKQTHNTWFECLLRRMLPSLLPRLYVCTVSSLQQQLQIVARQPYVVQGISGSKRGFTMQTDALHPRADAVLTYWIGPAYAQPQPAGSWAAEEQTKLWFKGGPAADQYITEHFSGDISKLVSGGYEDWLQTPLNAVAGIILADQFTRNVHRGTAQAFALDEKARQWSHHVRTAWDIKSALPSAPLRYFSYMPLMHSEELKDQELLVQLVNDELSCAKQNDPDSAAAKQWKIILSFAEAHRDVIKQWGRFPHRNALVGRQNTPEEEAGLKDGSIPKW